MYVGDNLKCSLRVTQDHWKWYHSKAWVRFLIRTNGNLWMGRKNSASAVSYRVDWARSKTLERRDKNRSNSLSVTENETTTLAEVSKRWGSVCRRERDHYASQSVINLFGQTFAKHLATSYTLLLLSTSYTKYKISINTKEKQKEQQKK